jgi:hypothetical protein
LIQTAIDLRTIGICELAWTRDVVFEVVNVLRESEYAILGGDVYEYNTTTHKLTITCDSWYFNPNYHDAWADYVEASANHSIDYIKMFSDRNGDGFAYSLVFHEKDVDFSSDVFIGMR